jgi:hypothetical protein
MNDPVSIRRAAAYHAVRESAQVEGGQPRIYVAGAYTSATSTANDTNGPSEGSVRAVNGVISDKSPWRQLLEDTERALGSVGWSVFLPHREVSRWGSRKITPGEVAAECLSAVALCDAVLAILGESFGTHVEVGMALGLGIPTVVVRSKQKTESYFGAGVADSGFVAPLVLSDLRELPSVVASGGFIAAYEQATAKTSAFLSSHK